MPLQLTGGAGYKANPTYENVMPSGIRRASAAFRAMDKDRADSITASQSDGDGRRSSVVSGGAVSGVQAERRGSVLVASSATRRESVLGLEATAGTNMDPNRKNSTSLASDLFHKMKGDRKPSVSH